MSMLVELINISKRNSLLALTQDAGSMDISVDFLLQTVYKQKNGWIDREGRPLFLWAIPGPGRHGLACS